MTSIGIVLVLVLASCASRPPAPPLQPSPRHRHIVKQGETLWSIAQLYGTSVEVLSLANRIRDPSRLRVGQQLVVPAWRATLRPRPGNPWNTRDPRGAVRTTRFIWPVRGTVTSVFGMRNGAHHDGIDISAKPGTAVRAIEAGRVIHSDDSLQGYGNLVIIKHSGTLSSVYAHNRRNRVRVGDFVERGQMIAESGDTGRTTAPHLHFEIRRSGKPVDPLDYLP